MTTGGQNLRALREQLGLTMRDVETASAKVAARHGNEEYAVPPSRLSDIETKNIVPSIFRLYSFAVIYRRDLRDLMRWYGVDLNSTAVDLELISPPKSHFSEALANLANVQLPVRLDPSFDPRKTANFGRLVEQWGLVPLAYLSQFASCDFTYGYIGSEDWTMYPILPPGSFVQVDESKNKVAEGGWRSEYERPIYFVETREGHICSWCTLTGDDIIMQPHPLSPVRPRVFHYPQDAEVIGQIVGVAIKLGDWRPISPLAAGSRAREVPN
jgi:transcriptional regulator with XRE-family HTH domain